MEVFKSLGYFGAYAHQALYAGRLGHGGGDVVGDDRLAGTYYHLDVGSVATVHDIFLCQQVGGGDNDGAQLVQGHDAEPEFIAAFQNEHHHVAVSDAEALEIAGRHVGVTLHVGKGKLAVFAFIVGPKQGRFVGLFGSPGVYDVVAEVEVLGDIYFQVFFEVLLGCKCGLL